MALIAAHLNAEALGIKSPSPPTSIPLSPLLPVPNKPYGFCGRLAPCLLNTASKHARKHESRPPRAEKRKGERKKKKKKKKKEENPSRFKLI